MAAINFPSSPTLNQVYTEAGISWVWNGSVWNIQQATPTEYVPYNGATGNVNLGEYGLSTGYLQFDTTPTTYTPAIGNMGWNEVEGTIELLLRGGVVNLPIGQKQVARIVNGTGTNVLRSNYQVVKVTGAQGQRLQVNLAQANNDANSADTLGLIAENINNNNTGFIITSGLLENIDTTGSLQGETWADGNPLYLSPTVPGRLSNVKPQAPDHTVIVGFVVYAHSNNGKIFVKVDNGYEIDELHNVKINTGTLSNGQVLKYNTSLSVWENASDTVGTGTVISVSVVSANGFAGTVATASSTPAITLSTTITGILKGNGTAISAAVANTDYQSPIALTTTGSSGASTFNGTTLNIPTYTLAGLGGFANPMTTLGDVIYGGASGVATRLAGNTTTAKQYLSQTGTGTVSAAPSWSAIDGADVTGAALTKTDDTNVTLTLGGTPSTSLLRAASLTLGWTGQLAVGRGGSGASTLTGVLIGNGTSAFTGVTGTAGQLLRRNAGNTAYEFFTPTYLTSYTETSTLQDVTNRGASTTVGLSLTGGISVSGGTGILTSGSGSVTSALRIYRSGQTPPNYNQFAGAWRSVVEVWNNTSDRLLHLAPPESDHGYSIFRSAVGGMQFNVGGTLANQGTTGLQIETTGSILVSNGSKISVMNSQDGGSSRGLFMWSTSDTNWGIYMAQSGAGKALSDGNAPAGIDGRTAHAIRFRAAASTTTQPGFIWENSNDETLMQLQPDTGNLYVRGQIYAGNSTSNTVWHTGNLTPGNYLPLLGGTMTGNITWGQTDRGLVWTMNTDGAYIKFFNTGDGDTDSRLEYATSDNANEYHRFLISGNERFTIKDDAVRFNNNVIWHAGNITPVRTYGTTNNNIDSDYGECFITFDPVPSGTPPISSPNIRTINVGNDFNRRTQLAFDYASTRGWFRRKHDGAWNSWVEFIHSGNIGSQTVSNAYTLASLNNYVWDVTSLPNTYPQGIQSSFVGPGAPLGSWQSYGSVLTMRTYNGGGGSLQLYVPYSTSFGGNALQVRFGNYDVSEGNSWTSWKTVLQSDNYNSYAPTLTGGGASGTWSIKIRGTDNTYANGLLQSGAGRTDDAAGDTWIFSDSLGSDTNKWGIKHNQLDNNIEFWGNNARRAYIDLASGHIYTNYVLGSYFNASAGNSENPTIGQIWTQNTSDNYLRKSTPAHFISQLGLITTSSIGSQSVNYANYAAYLPTLYAGGQQLNPQTYFGQSIGLRVAMTASNFYWNDTLWINGYSGGDVLSMCALHTARNGQPRMWISSQNSNATSYGTQYEFITGWNTDGVYGAKYQINNDWLRVNSDNRQFQMYGNGRTMIYRTDGNTNDHGGGAYAHIFYYGGSADGNRVFIVNTDGRLYSPYHGWLDTMSISGNAGGINTTQPTIGYSISGQNIEYGAQGGPQVMSQGSGAAMMSFHRPGAYAINLGLGTDNQLRTGGWSRGGNYVILDSGNYTSYAMQGAGYSANQNLNTTSGPTFAGITSTANINLNSNELRIGSTSSYHSIEVGVGRTGSGFAYIDLIGDTTYDDFGLRIMRGNGGENTYSLLEHRGTGDFIIETNEPAAIVFNTWGTTRAIIQSTGEVWIGNLGDQGAYNLQVGGTGVWGAGAYVNGSDRRLKENIKPIEKGIDLVTKLKPVSFNYIPEFSKDNTTQSGFIAQDLIETFKDEQYLDGLVSKGKEYYNVAYQNLIPVLTKAIQELKKEVDSLKAEIVRLNSN